MQFTIFSCGIFMERFAPNGLHGYCGIGGGAGLLGPNDYLVNVEAGTAQILENDARGRPAQVALTSVYDVARFIAAAIEVGPHTWPREIRMRGDHMSVGDIVTTVANVRNSLSHILLLLKLPANQLSSPHHSHQEQLSTDRVTSL